MVHQAYIIWVSSEASKAPADKRQGKNLRANQASINFQRKCVICCKENHLQGLSTFTESGKSSKDGTAVFQDEEQMDMAPARSLDRKRSARYA